MIVQKGILIEIGNKEAVCCCFSMISYQSLVLLSMLIWPVSGCGNQIVVPQWLCSYLEAMSEYSFRQLCPGLMVINMLDSMQFQTLPNYVKTLLEMTGLNNEVFWNEVMTQLYPLFICLSKQIKQTISSRSFMRLPSALKCFFLSQQPSLGTGVGENVEI